MDSFVEVKSDSDSDCFRLSVFNFPMYWDVLFRGRKILIKCSDVILEIVNLSF